MKIEIIDKADKKKNNKIRDDSFKEYCKKANDKEIKTIRVKRNKQGEIILWEVDHYPKPEVKTKSKKEVSK